jgi:phage/plasmid-like protein (TIGR03299 family)
MIDETTGRAAIAYVGKTPWHSLGQELTPGQPIDVWAREAGINYDVVSTPVMYSRYLFDQQAGAVMPPSEDRVMVNRKVLYRSDTGTALSVVGNGYKIVQPSEVLEFFEALTTIGGFELETAGALSDGKRIWALAKVNDGAPVIGQDIVRPYVLLATSYDGTLATTAKFTAIRVVCHNTLTMAAGATAQTGMVAGKSEADTEAAAVSSLVRIPHSTNFNAEDVRLKLGIVGNVFERWMVEARMLADTVMTEGQAEVFTERLLDSLQPQNGTARVDVTKTKGYTSVMELFTGKVIGNDLTGGNSRWKMLNCITEQVDHHRGKSDNTRIASAWFGAGEGMKNRAFQMLTSKEQFVKLETA